MMGRGLRLRAIVVGVALFGVALSAATARPAARSGFGLLSHYELCEGGGWMTLGGDIAVRAGSGDVWLEEGGFSPRLIHATTTGAVIGFYDGSGIPGGFSNSFGLDFRVAFSPTGVYVADANERYVNLPGRLLKFSTDRTPVFLQHFKRPPGFLPSDSSGIGRPFGLISFNLNGTSYVGVLDDSSLVVYQDDGTFVDDLLARANPYGENPGSQPGWSNHPGPGGITAARFILVSDPANGQVKVYKLAGPDPPFTSRFTLVHVTDLNLKVGRIAAAPDGSVYGLTADGLVHFSVDGSVIDELKVEGAKGLAVGGDGNVWITRDDGILRLGPGGGPIPALQNHYPNHCGPPRISRSVPSSQDIASTGQLAIVAGCDEPCRLQLAGTLTIPRASGAAATYKLRPSSRQLAQAGRARMSLGISKPALLALGAAKRRHQRSTALIQITATDTGGGARRQPLLLYLG
jgi:hypothetical protein